MVWVCGILRGGRPLEKIGGNIGIREEDGCAWPSRWTFTLCKTLLQSSQWRCDNVQGSDACCPKVYWPTMDGNPQRSDYLR